MYQRTLVSKKYAPRAEKNAIRNDIKELEQARAVNAKYAMKYDFQAIFLNVNEFQKKAPVIAQNKYFAM